MLEFGDSRFFIDMKTLNKIIYLNEEKVNEVEVKSTFDNNNALTMMEVYEKKNQKKELDIPKYDLLKTFIEYIIDYNETLDDTLGAERALRETPLGYKIVFNTLLNEGIIKEK